MVLGWCVSHFKSSGIDFLWLPHPEICPYLCVLKWRLDSYSGQQGGGRDKERVKGVHQVSFWKFFQSSHPTCLFIHCWVDLTKGGWDTLSLFWVAGWPAKNSIHNEEEDQWVLGTTPKEGWAIPEFEKRRRYVNISIQMNPGLKCILPKSSSPLSKGHDI